MRSQRAEELADAFQRKAHRLNATRQRIEDAFSSGGLRLLDVEASYSGLFLQAVVAYEKTIEDFVLGLMVRPGGVKSSNSGVRARINVRTYSHAMELASGPGSRYPSWIGEQDLKSIAGLLLFKGQPFQREMPLIDWSYVRKSQLIRNAIAHPSEHALRKFQRQVLQATPLPARERNVAGYLRGRATGLGQTRWELYVAGLSFFVKDLVR